VKEDFSIRRFADTVRRCKLYDFEAHRWLDFDGRPTTETIDIDAVRARLSPADAGISYALPAKV
jgi:hypothetical protein